MTTVARMVDEKRLPASYPHKPPITTTTKVTKQNKTEGNNVSILSLMRADIAAEVEQFQEEINTLRRSNARMSVELDTLKRDSSARNLDAAIYSGKLLREQRAWALEMLQPDPKGI